MIDVECWAKLKLSQPEKLLFELVVGINTPVIYFSWTSSTDQISDFSQDRAPYFSQALPLTTVGITTNKHGWLQGESRWAAWGLRDLINIMGMSSAEEVPVSMGTPAESGTVAVGVPQSDGRPQRRLFFILASGGIWHKEQTQQQNLKIREERCFWWPVWSLKTHNWTVPEPVNTLNPKAYFPNTDSWPTVPGGPWGPLLGAPRTGAELWG